MLGQTTSQIGGDFKGEKLNIVLQTNQAEHSDLMGTSFAVKYSSIIENYVWEGKDFLIKIPPYVDYEIIFNEITNYKSPEYYQSNAISGNNKTLLFTYQTEIVNIGLESSEGESLIGTVITVNGTSYVWDGNLISLKIPYGESYKITVSDVESYITPNPYEKIANNPNNTVILRYIYNPDPGIIDPGYGIWIRSIEGKYYTVENWTNEYPVNCIAVISDEHSFGIALSESSEKLQINNDSRGTLENYASAKSTEDSAKNDYNGLGNTANIIKLQSGNNYAAGYTRSFTFPDGQKGYLPACGQLWIASQNKTQVNNALQKVGGTLFQDDWYWTSTFYGKYSDNNRICWRLYWGSMISFYDAHIAFYYRVRPFIDLQ